MTLNLETTVPVRQNEDGLWEENKPLDLATATPIPEIRAAKLGEIPYTPSLTPEQKAQAVVEQSYKETGKQVPLGLKADWILTSPQVQAITQTALAPEYSIFQGIRGAITNSGQYDLLGNIMKGIVEPQATKKFVQEIPGFEKLPNWAQTISGVAEDILGTGAVGIGKGLLKNELLVKGITSKIDSAAGQFADENISKLNLMPSGPITEDAIRNELKNGFKARILNYITAPEVQAQQAEGVIGEAQPITAGLSPSILENYAQRRSLLGLIVDDLKSSGEAGELRLPKIGESISFTNQQGLIQSGIIREIVGNRATIDMNGKTIFAPLTHIFSPEISPATSEAKSQVSSEGELQKLEEQKQLELKQGEVKLEQQRSALAREGENKLQGASNQPPVKPPETTIGAGASGENLARDFQYVKNEPIEIKPSENDKAQAADLRLQHEGVKNVQIVRGNQFVDELRKSLLKANNGNKKSAGEEERAMTWYAEASGDKNLLETMKGLPQFAELKPVLDKAMNLSPTAMEWLKNGAKFYNEGGQVSKDLGTIREVLDDYRNRLYAPEKETNYIKSEGGVGLKQTTRHSKHRVYTDLVEAIKKKKKMASDAYGDNLMMWNQEMANVNANRKLADAMSNADTQLGKWVRPENIPDGWAQVGNLRKSVPIKDKNGEAVIAEDGNQLYSHSVFAAPKGIAEGLRALVDPDFLKRIPIIRGLQQYQGLTKAINLSFSLFHHLTFVTQTLSSAKGWATLADMRKMFEALDTPEFRELEQYWVKHGMMTGKVEDVQDLLRHLSQGDDLMAKTLRAPGFKQVYGVMEKSNSFLFDYMQRFLKVCTAQANMSNWVVKHPDATNDEIKSAAEGIAKSMNSTYGGLNWAALGVSKTMQSIMRFFLLAPDWLSSAFLQTKYAFSEWGNGAEKTAGKVARNNIFWAIFGGILATEGLNKILTGHFTDKNPKGHKLEVQIAPHVYTSFVRGAPGEIVKLTSNLIESGGAGVARYIAGKGSPLSRAGVTAIGGRTYQGKDTWAGKRPLEKTLSGARNLAAAGAPEPFSVSNIFNNYLSEPDKTALGWGAMTTGLGRYSVQSQSSIEKQNKEELQNAVNTHDENAIDKMLDEGKVSEAEVNKAESVAEETPAMRKAKYMRAEKLIDFLSKSNNDVRDELQDELDKKIDALNASKTVSDNRKDAVNATYEKYMDKYRKR